ncbi:MAG: MarC family protein [Actinobacteria bacterium]|nr:MarC family protein [Actinomycetota bacterium]
MDPIGTIPVFLSVTRGSDARERGRAAWQAALVAAAVTGVFAFFGESILVGLGIGMPALQAAGGLLLLLLALELLRPFDEAPGESPVDVGNRAFVPLGTPLLAGPGAIATVMVFMHQSDGLGARISVVAALLTSVLLVYVVLRFSSVLNRLLKPNGIQVVSRVMGFLVAAVAVELVVGAVEQWSGGRAP